MRRLLTLTLCLLLTAALFAAGSQEKASKDTIIATTSWTAAFAQTAGLENVKVLAPYELQHPPEYEITPADIKAVGEAKMIIYAGYEVMMQRLKEAASSEAQLIKINTDNTLPAIREGVGAIAEAAGTQKTAAANLAEIEAFFDSWKKELAPYSETPIVTHMFLAGLAKSLGLNVVGTYGPAPLEAKQLKELAGSDAMVIIDNWHTDVGAPLKEVMPSAKTAVWINFPGKDDTKTLLDVLKYNSRELKAALEQ